MTVAKYTIGFILSLLLSLVAYFYVELHGSADWVTLVLGVLAVTQMIVQLVFFLHLGDEAGPRYRLLSFVFMFGTLVIIVVGSIWIMANMNYNMMQMTPTQKENYMTTKNDMSF